MVPNPITRTPVQPTFTPMVTVSSSSIPAHASELHKSYLRALQQAGDEAPSPNMHLQNNTKNLGSNSASQTSASAVPEGPLITRASTDIPDLLSGFEKVVKEMKHVMPEKQLQANALQTNPLHDYSPPFTSRSFDEFHRFLGRDEILLDTITTDNIADKSRVAVTTNMHVTSTSMNVETILPTAAVALDTAALFSTESYSMMAHASASEAHAHNLCSNSMPGFRNNDAYDFENILRQVQAHRDHHSPPNKSESLSTNSSFFGRSITNPPANVTIPNRTTNVGLPSTKDFDNTRIKPTSLPWNHHVTASSRSEDANIVSGSEPSGGSSSSRSNTSNTSSCNDTTSNDDDGSEDEEEGLTSSGGEFDSAEDDDNNISSYSEQPDEQVQSLLSSSAPRKRVKYSNNQIKQKRGDHGKARRVQFQ
jgi:hypothetical protein